MLKTVSTIVLAAFMLTAVACKHKTFVGNYNNPDPEPEIRVVENNIHAVQEGLDEHTSDIGQSLNDIRSSTSSMRSLLPSIEETLRPKFDRELMNINTYANDITSSVLYINTLNANLDLALSQLEVAENKVDVVADSLRQAASDNTRLQEERDSAIASKNDATQKMLRWLIIACVVGSGVSIALMFYGNFAIGSMLLAGCAGTATIAIAVNKYFDYIAIGGLVVLALVGVYVVYKMYMKEKALQEVVKTAEIAKRRLPISERRKVFGYREEPGLAEAAIQSPSTIKEVDKVRKNLKKRWEHFVDDLDAKEMDEFDKQLRSNDSGEAHVIIAD